MADIEIDIERLKKGIAKAAQYAGNGVLSTMQNSLGQKEPSVIVSRDDRPFPKYPFAIVDYIDQEKPNGWGLEERVNQDGEVEYYDTRRLLFRLQVFDRRSKQQAASIANRILNRFMLSPKYRHVICDETGGAILEYILDIQDLSSTDKEGYLHSYGFNILLVAPVKVTDENPEFIDVVGLDVDLLRVEDDNDPLEITINETIYP